MSEKEAILTNKSQLHKYVTIHFALDSKIMSRREIKIGDVITGHVVLTNKKILSCKDIYVGLAGRARLVVNCDPVCFPPTFVAVNFLIQKGMTQNGEQMNVKAIPKGTHRFPFTLKLPNTTRMPATFLTDYAEYLYDLQVMIVFSTGTHVESLPINIKENWNIRNSVEYQTPLYHFIEKSLSRGSFRGKSNFKIVVTSPRCAFTVAEKKVPFAIDVGTNEHEIKNIEVMLVMCNYMSYYNKLQYYKEKVIALKKLSISTDTRVVEDELEIPPGLKLHETAVFGCTDSTKPKNQEIFFVGRVHILKMVIEPLEKFGKKIKDFVPIYFGTMDEPMDSDTLGDTRISRQMCVWDSESINSSCLSLLPTYSDIPNNESEPPQSQSENSSIMSLETLPPSFEQAVKMIGFADEF